MNLTKTFNLGSRWLHFVLQGHLYNFWGTTAAAIAGAVCSILAPTWNHVGKGVILAHLQHSWAILGSSWAFLAETGFVYERGEGLAEI